MIALASGLTIIASLAVIAPAAAAGGDYPKTATASQAVIESALTTTGAISVTAGLTDTQGLLWQGVAGTRDASGAAPSAETIYGIGSTSKMLATAAVMQLVDAGKVGLDRPVVKYLPAFSMRSPQYRQITVRMLLNHSAGLPGSYYANAMTTRPYAEYANEVLAYLANSELKTTPGAMSVYCNDCFTLAGELVAKVSGMPFPTYVQRNLLAPLGMTDSEYVTGALPSTGTAARVVVDGRTAPFEVTNVYASGGLMSTPADMLSFGRMLLNSGVSGSTRILTASSIAAMGAPQLPTTLNPIQHNPWNYGLGWDTVADLSLQAVGVRAWAKGGDTFDYHSSLVVAPEAGLAAFVAGAGPFSSHAAQSAAEEILLNALAERGDIPAVPAKVGTAQPADAVPSEDDVNAIVGTYLGTPGLIQRIARGPGSTLTLERFEGGAWTMRPVSLSFRTDGAWWPTTPVALALRAVTGWGRTYLVYEMPDGYGNTYGWQMTGQRMTASGPTNKAWKARLGQWLYVNEVPTATTWLGTPAIVLAPYPGLPGYLDLSGLTPVDAHQADIGTMFLQVPLMFGRDLDDLVMEGPSTMRLGAFAMVQRSSLPDVATGTTSVRIGADGYAQWRAVPQASRMAVTGADAWYVYDADLNVLAHGFSDATAVRAPKGGLLLVFGDPGEAITIDVTTAR